MHIHATAQKASICSNYNRCENKNRPKRSYAGLLPKYQFASHSQEENTGIFQAFTLAKLSISSVSSISSHVTSHAPSSLVSGDSNDIDASLT